MDSDATIREGKTGETLNNPNTLPTTTWIWRIGLVTF